MSKMTIEKFIERVNYRLLGTDGDAPEVGSEDYLYWIDTLNQKKSELFEDVAQDWLFAWSEGASAGTVVAAANPVFDMPDTFLGPSDQVYVVDTDGRMHYYDVVKAQNRNLYKQQVYLASNDPQKLYFTQPILAGDQIIGGTLYVPGFYEPADVDPTTEPTTTYVPLPDANWGVMAVAAEVAFNDVTYEDKAPDINTKANSLYGLMVRKNRRGTASNPRTSATGYNRNRIRGY